VTSRSLPSLALRTGTALGMTSVSPPAPSKLPSVYSTCLYCSRDLGANAVLETLPIGRRVAFDERQGRLWVVCRSCEKWNLVPFDTRLETIDQCERLFAGTRVRFSTDNIGIARRKEGLELVRIGPAQRPEFAAWRYGDQFGRRRWRNAAMVGGVMVAGVGLVVGYQVAVPLIGGSYFIGQQILQTAVGAYRERRAVVRIPEREGIGGAMTLKHVQNARIVSHGRDDWSLELPMYRGARVGFATGAAHDVTMRGQYAVETLGLIMPKLNASGGTQRTVQAAVERMQMRSPLDNPLATLLKDLDKPDRLALEMAAHEDTERTALAGELKLLERQWREAEEVAKIADSLAVSDDVDREVGRRMSS
jgi:hypothetical protein